jgi:hypothetical protein
MPNPSTPIGGFWNQTVSEYSGSNYSKLFANVVDEVASYLPRKDEFM